MSQFEHLVNFKKKINKNNLYYFDFSNNTWMECKQIAQLPYNLCKYQVVNSDNIFITCDDSYRLTENLENVSSNEEMHREKEWRDNIVKAREEVDLYAKDEWHKMVVAWVKADIIPDVLHLRKRRNESDLCGYYYKESKSLAKSQTKTPIISEEQLQKEKEQDERALKYRQERHNKIDEIEKSLKLFRIKDEYHRCYAPRIKELFFYDTLPYYQSLKLNNDKKLILKEEWSPNAKITYEEYLESSNLKKGFAKLALNTCFEERTADMVSIEDEYTDIKNCSQPLKTDYDAYYNIKIYNATYAKLKIDRVEIDSDVVDSTDDKKILGFKDITETNPIFNSTLSNTLWIHTDGDKITFDGILMDSIPRYITKCAQKFSVIHFPSKSFVLLANTFCYFTMTFDYERIEETPHISSYKLDRL